MLLTTSFSIHSIRPQTVQHLLLMSRSNSLLHAVRMSFLQDSSMGVIVPLFTDSLNMSRLKLYQFAYENCACMSLGEDAERRSCSLVTTKSRLSYILGIFFILPHSGVTGFTIYYFHFKLAFHAFFLKLKINNYRWFTLKCFHNLKFPM